MLNDQEFNGPLDHTVVHKNDNVLNLQHHTR